MEDKLSEEEIIERINKIAFYPIVTDKKVIISRKDIEAIQGLLDLYQKEKEKNLIFKGATIVSDLKNDGIEMKMNADKLVALYLEEKDWRKNK